MDGIRRRASNRAIVAALRILGAPINNARDASEALRARRAELEDMLLDPVLVAWDGGASVPLGAPTELHLRLEDGEECSWVGHPPQTGLPGPIPFGYHRLRAEASGREGEALVISAPRQAPRIHRTWGLFAPLYALRSHRDMGIGDLTEMEALLDRVVELGGDVVATLPLLARFTGDHPFEPSPYSPASRLFFDESFVGLERSPDLADCTEARELMDSPGFRSQVEALRSTDLVDHRGAAALKRRVLEILATHVFQRADGVRLGALNDFVAATPEVRDYAAFRAATEAYGAPWPEWPHPERDGRLAVDDRDPGVRYHLYAQWVVAEQLEAIGRRDRGGLYLDLPVGSDPNGYDVWRHRSCFALGASAGAPPDTFFTGGQEWGFMPLHPRNLREEGYGHLRAVIARLMRYAEVVRIDHVMGLHRLYWIPAGHPPTDGVYVRYPQDELYALLCLEAHRAGSAIVGEDLGTVPRGVRSAMRRHGLHRTYVLQYEVDPDAHPTVTPAPRTAFASMNTHDMPPFAAFWSGDDIRLRQRLGWLDLTETERDLADRARTRQALVSFLRDAGRLPPARPGQDTSPGVREIFRACVEHLADGEARVVVVGLEDLWEETEAQNVPGTTTEHPNWSRKVRHPIEEVDALPGFLDTLEMIQRLRGKGHAT